MGKQKIGCLRQVPHRGGSNEYQQSMFWAEIWKIAEFLSENFQFLAVKFSIYLNWHVFVMLNSGWITRKCLMDICEQRSHRLSCASAHSDQSVCGTSVYPILSSHYERNSRLILAFTVSSCPDDTFSNGVVYLLGFLIYCQCRPLTHCIRNRLSHTIYWKSPISILGTPGNEIYIVLEKNG